MSALNGKETFVKLLSDVRQTADRARGIYQELGKWAQDEDVKEALEARAFVADKNTAELDECFKLIGEKPLPRNAKLYETFAEDARKEAAQIQSPKAKRLFVLAKAVHLTHFRIGEYVVLVAAADATGHYGVGVLLESCLADKLAFVERTRRLIRARERELIGKNGKEMFVKLLSHVRQTAERAKEIFEELGQQAEDEDIKEALEARSFVADKNIAEIDECFRLIGEKPQQVGTRMMETFIEDARNELQQIESPEARRLYVLAKVIHLVHWRIAEYVVLIAAADATGHHGVGVLLESCLADKMAFVERTRRLIRAREREMAMA